MTLPGYTSNGRALQGAVGLTSQFSMKHQFRITVEQIADNHGNPGIHPPLTFMAGNHDNILDIVSRIQARGQFSPESAAAFAIGLKLFGEVMLEHRHDPLFDDFQPHFKEFMKTLKGSQPG
jgi:hypothetical protein